MGPIEIPEDLTKLAHRHIKEFILGGHFAHGERITEEYIAGKLGISKSPVREALTRLEVERLICIKPRRGAYLKQFEPSEVADIYDYREALEAHAVLTAKITPAVLREMKKSVKTLQEDHRTSKKTDYIKQDIGFHNIIARASGNHRLAQSLDSLQDELRILRLKTYELSSSNGLQAHADLLELLENNKRREAVNLMRQHIRSTRDELLAHMKRVEKK